MINNRAESKIQKIYNRITSFYKTLDPDIRCSDFDLEIKIVKSIIQSNESSKILLLNEKALKTKYHTKKSHITKLIQPLIKIENKLRILLDKFKEVLSIFENVVKFSFNKCIKIYNEKLKKIRNLQNHFK